MLALLLILLFLHRRSRYKSRLYEVAWYILLQAPVERPFADLKSDFQGEGDAPSDCEKRRVRKWISPNLRVRLGQPRPPLEALRRLADASSDRPAADRAMTEDALG